MNFVEIKSMRNRNLEPVFDLKMKLLDMLCVCVCVICADFWKASLTKFNFFELSQFGKRLLLQDFEEPSEMASK